MRNLRPLSSSLALLLAAMATTAACSSASSDGSQSSAEDLSQAQCNAAKVWAPNTAYKVGDVVSFEGVDYVVIQAHTSEFVWPPNIVPALYQVTSCSSSGSAAPAPAPTTAPAPTAAPTTKTPPPAAPPAATGSTGSGTTCVGGPKFDPAGTKNVGNGHGGQFIGGQCLSAADCASGCCALPCGICSGPGAQFQAGKEGCGFGN
jgi:hypothetical protein